MPLTDAETDRRRQIAHSMIKRNMMMQAAQSMMQPTPSIELPVLGNVNYQGHSPAASDALTSMFSATPDFTMQSGEPTPTGRDFGSTPAQDWGGAFDVLGNSPNPSPTMSSPAMTPSPNAAGTFDTGPLGMPSAPGAIGPMGPLGPAAPSGAFAPAGREAGDFGFGFGGMTTQGAALSSPGFGQGFAQGFNEGLGASMGGLGGLGGLGGGVGSEGGGAVGGMDTSGGGSSESGSSGVG